MPSATPKAKQPFIVLGVSGGIAAYKSIELLRLLRESGYHVAPVLTPDATRFVGALTFSALASEPARVHLYGDTTTPIPHTYLGQSADLIIVAPATAHLIARYAMGLADDLLCATLLASRAPVLLCPAMHTEMWEQPSVQENIATLRRRGVYVLDPDVGPLAGGDEGAGRLPDPVRVAALTQRFVEGFRGPLSGVRVVISAGGTREAIDPVRVLANRSTGHQGFALAEVAARLGADVTLVTTVERPLALDVARRIDVVSVESASEMDRAMSEAAATAQVVIMAAAVADFTLPAHEHKIKRHDGVPTLHLTPAVDVLANLVGNRRPGQLIIGFAAETRDVDLHARAKLDRKGVDLLVVNDVSAPGAGFAHPTNEVTLYEPDGATTSISQRSKEAVAQAIFARVETLLAQGAA